MSMNSSRAKGISQILGKSDTRNKITPFSTYDHWIKEVVLYFDL